MTGDRKRHNSESRHPKDNRAYKYEQFDFHEGHNLHYKRRKYTRESTPQLTLLEKDIHERINTTAYTTREGNTRENQHHSLHY